MQTDVAAEIERLVSLIVAEAHPVRVIRFGSAAGSDMTAGSDLALAREGRQSMDVFLESLFRRCRQATASGPQNATPFSGR